MMFINNGKKNYQPGKISLSGLNMNFDINSKKTYEVDWLPGGCILHAKKNIILDNYYPYKGKSYSEDLLLSALLKKNKIKLFHCTNSKSYFNIKNKDKNNILYIAYEIILNLRSMFYYNDTYGGSKIRLVFVIIIYYIWLFKYKVLSGKK